ncbi:hypothetical protein ACIQXD_05020 [Streptomyces uncialis]|uniref:hypothetical protein n=1 Tax=Streptomyces uncialis TaxID=1048205 RepID=UPI0037FC8B39
MSHRTWHTAAQPTPALHSVEAALAVARETVAQYADADIHNHPLMVHAATALRLAARDLIAALDHAADTR